MPFLRTDHWRSAIIHAPLEELIRNGSLNGFPVTLLPDPGDHRFLADPFGLWRNERLYVFAEAYDYRSPKGTIDVLVYDRTGKMIEQKQVLQESWHLSYPFVFEHEGETYLLPEATASGRLSLYRARNFPDVWERVDAFDFPLLRLTPRPCIMRGAGGCSGHLPAARTSDRVLCICRSQIRCVVHGNIWDSFSTIVQVPAREERL